MTGVYFTGAGVNPARAFGPAVVTHVFPGYHWIYWIGPILGSLVAAGLYKFMKILEYETANPGQDFDSPHYSHIDDLESQATNTEKHNGNYNDNTELRFRSGVKPKSEQGSTDGISSPDTARETISSSP